MLGHVLTLKNNKVSPRERSKYLLMSSKKLQNSFLPVLLNHTPTQDGEDLKLLPEILVPSKRLIVVQMITEMYCQSLPIQKLQSNPSSRIWLIDVVPSSKKFLNNNEGWTNHTIGGLLSPQHKPNDKLLPQTALPNH